MVKPQKHYIPLYFAFEKLNNLFSRRQHCYVRDVVNQKREEYLAFQMTWHVRQLSSYLPFKFSS